MWAVPIRFVFDLSSIFFFFLAINSASLWDPHFRLILNFVLFLHQPGWPQRLFCLFQHMVRVQGDRFQNAILRCVSECHGALGT